MSTQVREKSLADIAEPLKHENALSLVATPTGMTQQRKFISSFGMFIIKLSAIALFAGIIRCQQVESDNERPFLRILAPQFICNEKKNNQTEQSNITISLQTREGQSLRYSILVDFEMLGAFKSQRHTLSIWRNMRMLQKKFHNIANDISLKNQIEISAQELTPDVIYTFKIIGYDRSNRSSETQNFTLTYKGGELKAQQPDIGDGVSLLLFSSEFIYEDMELIVVAELLFCEPTNEFSFEWQINGMNITGIDDVTGNILRLPVGSLQAGKFIELIVTVLNNESKSLAKANTKMKILAKDFEAQIVPSDCLVGIGREIPFQALISRHVEAPIQDSFVKWTCTNNGADCSEIMGNSSDYNQQMTFSSDGIFELKSEISINEVVQPALSRIQVDAKVIPHVQIKHFPSQPIDVQQPNSIVVTILNLIPKCVAHWNIVVGEGFAAFESEVEGNFSEIGFISIKDFEEYFLHELVDYDNNTISKDVTLSLPSGIMKADAKYKFRLSMICPKPFDDTLPQEKTVNVTSYYIVILKTNGPPKTLPLLVQPSNGIPMKTSFKFSTGVAKDSPNDFPLKYSFKYNVENITVNIGTFYEATVAHSQLPFADSIETFCDVCDNNNACTRIKGPKVSANIQNEFSAKDYDFKLEEFAASLKRAEYSESINAAAVLLLTQRRQFNEDSTKYEQKMILMMKTHLEKLKVSLTKTYVYQQQIFEFVKMSKTFMNLMTISDEAFISELLSLTERSDRKVKRAIFATKPSVPIVNYDMDYIKNILGLSEILLSSSNESIAQSEKEKFVSKVYKFVPSVCKNKNLEQQTIEMNFVSLEVVKVYSSQLSVESQNFPGGENEASILMQINGNFLGKYVCLAKIKFFIDMFQPNLNNSQEVYEAIILKENENGLFKEVPTYQFSDLVRIDLPAASSDAMCLVRKSDGWSSEDCIKQKSNSTTKISCKCKTIGKDRIIMRSGIEMQSNAIQQTTIYAPFTIQSTPSTIKLESTSIFTFAPTMPTVESTQLPSSQVKSTSTKISEVSTVPMVGSLEHQVKVTTTTLKIPFPPISFSTNQPMTTKYLPTIGAVTITAQDNGTSQNQTQNASVSWALIILLLAFAALIIILFSIHKCRQLVESRLNLPVRSASTEIRYARYHDEFTMQG